MRPRAQVVWLASLLLAVGITPLLAGPDCDRVYAIGDLHGGDQAFVEMISELGLVDDDLAWSGGDDCLVQTGDVVDRGAGSRRILDLLIRLREESGGRVEMLLGNHEIMNMVGDLRYVSPAEFTAFAAEETPAERQAGYEAFARTRLGAGLEPERRRAEFEERHPPGWFGHRRAFLPDGTYGAWLLERPVALKIDWTLFVHGGLTGNDAAMKPAALTRRMQREIREYHRLRGELIEAGWLSPLTPFADSFRAVAALVEQIAPDAPVDGDVERVARRFLALCREASCIRPDGPVWNRELATADELEFSERFARLLVELGAARIVVSHTPTDDGRIDVRFGGRVFVIDTGAGPAYKGRISALEIARDGRVSAVYLDRRDVLVEAPRDEAAIERILLEGAVIESKEIGTGITKPLRLTLDLDGVQMRAAFKYMHIRKMGITRWRGRPSEFNFTDSYRYERAAYLLDRQLGIGMVPVTVLREVDGREGAVIEWIEDAIDEGTRRAEGVPFNQPKSMIHQAELMRLFDALIANDDRNLGNQLVTPHDGRLHPIDHTRAFRERRTMTDMFLATPISLPRELLPRLQALDRETLDRLLGDLLNRSQIKALLARRDALLEKIQDDRKLLGDDVVFFGEED